MILGPGIRVAETVVYCVIMGPRFKPESSAEPSFWFPQNSVK